MLALRSAFWACLLFFLSACQPTDSQPLALPVASPSVPQPLLSVLTPLTAEPALTESIQSAAAYLARQQLANGELSYQVNFFDGEREYPPSHPRLMEGVGALYAACRITADASLCDAGDRALFHYLPLLLSDPQRFDGACFYAEGSCLLGGAAVVVDTLYKRWQARGNLSLNADDLRGEALSLGSFLLSMQKADGGFYHAFDPHLGGGVDEQYFSPAFDGMGVVALLDLYEITGDQVWLKQARQAAKIWDLRPAAEDAWQCRALRQLARAEGLTDEQVSFARDAAQLVLAGEVRSLDPRNSSVSSAAKIESLSALAQALYLSQQEHAWLEPEIRAFITFTQARQLPNHNCGWTLSPSLAENFQGGIFGSCEDPTIRVDGVARWINGAASFLEYRSMIK